MNQVAVPQATSLIKSAIKSPIIVALDNMDDRQALSLADKLDPTLCRVKVGKELFTKYGNSLVTSLHQRDFEVFLDLKFHDIPNTTAQAVLAAADLGVWMVNVHASAGRSAMQTVKARLLAQNYQTLVIAVTVLTSYDDADLATAGYKTGVSDTVADELGDVVGPDEQDVEVEVLVQRPAGEIFGEAADGDVRAARARDERPLWHVGYDGGIDDFHAYLPLQWTIFFSASRNSTLSA